MIHKLDSFPVFVPVKEKQDNKLATLILDLIKSICCNFEAEKNKVLKSTKTQNKAMRWQKSEGSKIAEYNYQCMDRAIADEECGGTFQIPGVIDKVLRDKHSGVAVSQL